MVLGVAEAVGVAGGEFDGSVDALAFGVGDAGPEERFDAVPPGLDGGGQSLDLFDAAVGAPEVEIVEALADLGGVEPVPVAGQDGAEFLFGDPGGEDAGADRPGRFRSFVSSPPGLPGERQSL
nr:hypothetical protein [Saccharopolyspora pogona]